MRHAVVVSRDSVEKNRNHTTLFSKAAKQSHNAMWHGAFFSTSPQPRKDKKKETTIKMDFSFVGERAPFLQRQRKMMARDAVARAPPCRARSGNKQELRADVP